MKKIPTNQPLHKKNKPRTCVGCMEESPKRTLLRIVRTPEMEVLYDPTGRANGRGVYVCACVECIKQAKKKKALTRALKISIDDSIYALLEEACLKKENLEKRNNNE